MIFISNYIITMKSQKGGRVSMPFEFFNAGVKGPFTSNPAPATLARGMVDQSGCAMGPLQTGGKKTRRRRRRRRRKSNPKIIMLIMPPSVQDAAVVAAAAVHANN